MKTIPIIAGTRHELALFLDANPWIDGSRIANVTQPEDLLGRQGLVLALPGWEHSPTIRTPRKILEMIAIRGMQLVVLGQDAYTHDRSTKSIDDIIDQHNKLARGAL